MGAVCTFLVQENIQISVLGNRDHLNVIYSNFYCFSWPNILFCQILFCFFLAQQLIVTH